MLLLSSDDFFQNDLFQKFFQERYQSIKWFGSKSGPTLCLQMLSSADKFLTPKMHKQMGGQVAFVLNGGKRFNTHSIIFLMYV